MKNQANLLILFSVLTLSRSSAIRIGISVMARTFPLSLIEMKSPFGRRKMSEYLRQASPTVGVYTSGISISVCSFITR